jgi:hypothetical protein
MQNIVCSLVAPCMDKALPYGVCTIVRERLIEIATSPVTAEGKVVS